MIINFIICGGCTRLAAGGNLLNEAQNHPETAATVIDFIIAAVIYAIIASIIGGVAALVGKFIFNAKPETIEKLFYSSAIGVFVVFLICHFNL